jgi:hypothetical protein
MSANQKQVILTCLYKQVKWTEPSPSVWVPWLKPCKVYLAIEKVAKTVSTCRVKKSQTIYIKTQFESPKHLPQTAFLKIPKQTML